MANLRFDPLWTSRLALFSAGCYLLFSAEISRAADGARLEMLPEGVRVGSSAPSGWTRLVVKSLPAIRSGDVETLPRFAFDSASRFRTVILAEVERRGGEGGDYRIVRIGLGLCVPLSEGDLTILPGSRRSSELLNVVDREVLQQGYGELRKARIVASTPRIVLLQAPSVQRIGGLHEEVFVYYAFLLDPVSGELISVVWSLPIARGSNSIGPTPRRLKPDLVYPCGLDVSAVRLFGTVPVRWSFAMNDLPPGTPVVLDPGLRVWIERPGRIIEAPGHFAESLRRGLNP